MLSGLPRSPRTFRILRTISVVVETPSRKPCFGSSWSSFASWERPGPHHRTRYPRCIGQPNVIFQVPQGSAIERQLRDDPPQAFRADAVLVQTGPTDKQGNLEALAGQTVLSVPSFDELERQVDGLRHVLRQAGTGTQPLVILVGAAEVIEDRLATALVEAASDAPRPVFVRVIRPSES
jgi:hypothetical protein